MKITIIEITFIIIMILGNRDDCNHHHHYKKESVKKECRWMDGWDEI